MRLWTWMLEEPSLWRAGQPWWENLVPFWAECLILTHLWSLLPCRIGYAHFGINGKFYLNIKTQIIIILYLIIYVIKGHIIWSIRNFLRLITYFNFDLCSYGQFLSLFWFLKFLMWFFLNNKILGTFKSIYASFLLHRYFFGILNLKKILLNGWPNILNLICYYHMKFWNFYLYYKNILALFFAHFPSWSFSFSKIGIS